MRKAVQWALPLAAVVLMGCGGGGGGGGGASGPGVVTTVSGLRGWTTGQVSGFQVNSGDAFGAQVVSSGNTAWVRDGAGNLFRTTTNGSSWTPLGALKLDTVQLFNGNTLMAGGLEAGGALTKSINGGDTWTPLWPANARFGALFHAQSADSAWVVDGVVSGTVVRRTSNGGANWSADAVTFSPWASLLGAADGQAAWLRGTNGQSGGAWRAFLLRTTNGGSSWSTIRSDIRLGSGVVNVIAPVNASTAWFAADDDMVYRTTDGTTLLPVLRARVSAIQAIDANHAVALGYTTGVYETFDGGRSWTYQELPRSTSTVWRGLSVTASGTWVVADDGSYYRKQ